MILVVGGANQGKKEYATQQFFVENWASGETCTKEEVFSSQGVCHFELLAKRLMGKEENFREFAEDIIKLNEKIIIVTNEIGCGLVPVDAFMRTYREEYGRVCTYLASQAKEVHRVMCGIGRKIKG